MDGLRLVAFLLGSYAAVGEKVRAGAVPTEIKSSLTVLKVP